MDMPIGPVESGIKLKDKACGKCKAKHEFAPNDSAVSMNLLWWNCKCGSTLAYEIDKLNER